MTATDLLTFEVEVELKLIMWQGPARATDRQPEALAAYRERPLPESSGQESRYTRVMDVRRLRLVETLADKVARYAIFT